MKNQNVNTRCCYCQDEIGDGEGRYLVLRDQRSVYSCVTCHGNHSGMSSQSKGSGHTIEEAHYCHSCKNRLESGNLSYILMKDEDIIYFCGDCARENLEN